MSKISINTWNNIDCRIGRLSANGFKCFTLELPYRGNQQDVSSIPKGVYEYYKKESSKNGSVLELRNVADRSYIQIHAGNFTRQIQGCILVGDSVKYLDGDGVPDVTNSKTTLKKLLSSVDKFGTLEIY